MTPYIQKVKNDFKDLMEGKTLGTIVPQQKGVVFVDGESNLEYSRLENFISNSLSSQTSSIVSVIEGMHKHRHIFETFKGICECGVNRSQSEEDRGYNQALDDLLTKLKEKGMVE